MSHTYTNLLVHVIFSTKNREPFIKAKFKPDLHAYIGGVVRELKGTAMIVGGTENHVHLLARLPAMSPVADVVRIVKANTSKWVHEKWPEEWGFGWQTGYAALTVSESKADGVRRYIADQENHHRTISFEDEFVAFLRKNGIPYDPRYVLG